MMGPIKALGWVKRLFGSFERRLNDINGGVAVWRVNDRLKCAPPDLPLNLDLDLLVLAPEY